MGKLCFSLLSAVLLVFLINGETATASSRKKVATGARTHDGSEEWGYVEVRPKAHMFWWLYRSPNRVEDASKPWPIILWLQGGPGGSGVGMGNFEEIGPLDTYLKPRNSTWLQVADLLFVDNPVGTGYSFVEEGDADLFVKTDDEAATDLTTLLEKLFNRNESLQKSPLYIVAESYGGKFAVTLGLSALKAIEAGKLKLKLGGVALGDTWISPEDFVVSWGPLLRDLSRLDSNGLGKAKSLAEKISQQIREGQYADATDSWSELEEVISANSNSVDFYNFLLDSGSDPVSLTTAAAELSQKSAMKSYTRYISSLRSLPAGGGGGVGDLDSIMNGVIKRKLKIIPANFSWGEQSSTVFSQLEGDFMRPRINEVDELLAKGVSVTIYSGQLDLICSTKGTEAWVEKLRWEGLSKFLGMSRTPLFCGAEQQQLTRGFTKSYKNLNFFWILGAGHFVPVDQPCIALKMVGQITQSPAAEAAASAKKDQKSKHEKRKVW
ncbi:SERINE PROTEASE FAMILY S10 SERINE CARBOXYPEPTIDASE [Salix koriyanagi]|uniref:Carboxypeptidase n=1 Tax=Salix koriyanagi TaxID=2511006 RepID=A0A9Q0TQD4_9ROSI|nr:SERINE PROTEASE FAMILY S10 SERINE CARBOXYPEPTIDASE [Salix koriyanagi]